MSEIELKQELDGIDDAIVEAAVDGNHERFVRLNMRKTALPTKIREARVEELRKEIERLESESAEIVAERDRLLGTPAPPVPAHLRGELTNGDMQRIKMQPVANEEQRVSRELRDRRKKLKKVLSLGSESPRQPLPDEPGPAANGRRRSMFVPTR